MLLIGLGAKARQGKDTVAHAMIAEALEYPVITAEVFSFAKELKLYCRAHHEELFAQYCMVKGRAVAVPKDDPIYGYTDILQWYGTEVVRKQDPDHWIKEVDRHIQAHGPDVAIIADVRFPNEAEYVHERGGKLVEVIRYNADESRFLDPNRDPKHPSETALDSYLGWDYILTAKSGEVGKLEAKARHLINNLLTDANEAR